MVITITFKSGSRNFFKNFEQLFLSNKHIVLGEIVTLDCNNNQIEVIPPEIQFLTSLREFHCWGNQIKVIPPEIQFLTNLQKFHCWSNQIEVIPPEIQFLTSLQEFHYYGNQIQVIPPEIQFLTSLREFYCWCNQIQVIPPEIRGLTDLQKFDCSYNKIKVILPEIQFLTNLQWFDCKYNQIQVIPPEIRKLTNLKQFRCDNNQIQVIPPEIRKLTNLQEFNCGDNQIRVIPPEIQFLTNLRRFYCWDNQIRVIPPEIRFLTNLQQFYCGSNQIEKIPFEITYCRRLRTFIYSINPIGVLNPAVERFINRSKNISYNTIYTDAQSVHNSTIQSSIKESIIAILNEWTEKVCEEKILDHLLKNELITTQEQLLEYFTDNTVHSVINITFKELFLIIYNRLVKDDQTEVFKILNQEMKDSECKCFTGRLNRLVSSLSGFYSEAKVSISKSDEMSNVISVMKKQFLDISILKQKVSKELLSRGYSKEEFEEWLIHIE